MAVTASVGPLRSPERRARHSERRGAPASEKTAECGPHSCSMYSIIFCAWFAGRRCDVVCTYFARTNLSHLVHLIILSVVVDLTKANEINREKGR